MTLANTRIAIFGLGLMGGSLALALQGKCAALFGVDPDTAAIALAKETGIVSHASSDPAAILPQTELIILAAPVRAIISLIHELPTLHSGEAIVLDLGSTKAQIVAAMSHLPTRFDPIGGHPMCGKEKSSLANADARLFEAAPFALTPLPRTTAQACNLAEELVCTIGARPLWLEAETHDRWVAATSHLPHLLSVALTLATPEQAAPLIGSGFRSMARLALSPPTMRLDILTTNRTNILQALEAFRTQLDDLENLLKQGDDLALGELLAQAGELHQKLHRLSNL